MSVVAAIAFGLGVKVAWLDASERKGHLGIGDETAPAHLYAVDTKFLRRQLDQPLGSEPTEAGVTRF
jgi:hypothetical protein